jgi:DNA-binding CsgD family transcriptional regulator
MERPVGASRRSLSSPPATLDTTCTASLALEATSVLGTGLVLVDQQGAVAFANVEGERLLALRSVLRTISPLAVRDAESNNALRRTLIAASANASGALQLRDCRAEPVINAVVMPLRLVRHEAHGSQPAILLAMTELFHARAIPDAWLSQLFGLTPTESSIANWLAAGRTIAAYAKNRRVSVATARSQLKAVLAKTGLSRQVQLVAALARLPIGDVYSCCSLPTS